MVKHTILWHYTEAADDYGKEKLIEELNRRFKELIPQIDGMISIEIKPCTLKADPAFHDLMLSAEFRDADTLRRYMLDEGHAQIREWDKQYVCDRAGFDYEV